jgi:Tol biopolymer transport system component
VYVYVLVSSCGIVRKWRWIGLAGLVCMAVALAGPAAAPAFTSYMDSPVHISTNPFTFGQAPVFMPDGRVVASDDFGHSPYNNQTYVANRDGSGMKCLTCELPSENLVPAVRPQGDWILFHSWQGHQITLGAAGYGGIGSQLYAMRSDGSDVTKLYADPAVHDGEGTDDYHAYWSPDGKRIVWTHFNGNIIDGNGQGRWDVRVADFVVKNGKPALTDVRVVRPANGHWYETQWWAPDGSGFLYTESYGTAIDTELFYCRLPKSGPCQSTQLTDTPAWNEQALFTPDMKDVIFMSSRDHPGFLNTWITAARELGLTSAYDNFLILPIFDLGYMQPVAGEATDLYEENLQTHAVRRLTTDGNQGWVTPEFSWTPQGNELFWTENRLPWGLAVPLPLNVVDQVQDTLAYLQHPEVNVKQLAAGNLVNTVLPVQQQTRVMTFPGTCAPPRTLTLNLHHAPHAGVTRARAWLDGRRIAARRGRSLRRLRVTRPLEQEFTIKLLTVQSTGQRTTTEHPFTGMGCYPGRVTR